MLSVASRVLPDYGRIYCPSGDGPFPAPPRPSRLRRWLVRLVPIAMPYCSQHTGFLAYPHAYSRDGNAWNAGAIKDVPLEHTAAALQALRDFDSCSGKVGLYGLSRGAEHALLLTSLMGDYR